MKAVFLLCALVVAVAARPEDLYTDRYDGVNYKEVVSNDRLLQGYVKCCLDLGKCTAEAKELKSHIEDALKTECAKCTPKQKEGTEYVIAHLINKKPEYWKQLCDKYDPEGKYTAKYEKQLKKIA